MRRKRWLILLVSALVLAFGAYLNRGLLIRVMIASHIRSARVFTPPPLEARETRWHRFLADTQFYWDLAGLRMARNRRAKQLDSELKPLIKELRHHQAAGERMRYSMPRRK